MRHDTGISRAGGVAAPSGGRDVISRPASSERAPVEGERRIAMARDVT